MITEPPIDNDPDYVSPPPPPENGGPCNVWDTDHRYPNAQVEWYSDIADMDHGINGHTGHRCLECARMSGVMVAVESDSGDYWQNKQLDWQEECDRLIVGFNEKVALHFPKHSPMNCTMCPKAPPMPERPNPPVERHR